jgi:hypothetical protein
VTATSNVRKRPRPFTGIPNQLDPNKVKVKKYLLDILDLPKDPEKKANFDDV